MKSKWAVPVIASILILGTLGNAFALNPVYLGENIAQTGDMIAGKTLTGVFGIPQIADNGDVIFRGDFATGSGIFLFQPGSPPTYTLLAETGDVIDTFELTDILGLSINDNGDIVFVGSLSIASGLGRGIFLIPSGDPSSASLLAKAGGIIGPPTVAGKALTDVDLPPSINNARDVVFTGDFSGGSGIFLIPSDSSPSLLAKTGDVIDTFELTDIGVPSINNNGKVVFFGRNFGVGDYGIFLIPSGGSPSLLVKDGDSVAGKTLPEFFDEFAFLNGFPLNDNGDVVFTAFTPALVIFLIPGGDLSSASVLVTEDDSIDGQTLTFFDQPSRNNNGDLLFFGFIADDRGIFTSTNLIAKAGDTIDGLTLSAVDFPSMNNNGDVVFVGTGSDLASTLECGAGTTLNTTTNQCEADPQESQCALGTTLNVSTNECEADVTQSDLNLLQSIIDGLDAFIAELLSMLDGTVISSDFDGNLEVGPSDTLTINGVTINGNIVVNGGELTIKKGSTITGDVLAVDSPSVTITESSVNGNVVVTNSQNVSITGNSINGDLTIDATISCMVSDNIVNGNTNTNGCP